MIGTAYAGLVGRGVAIPGFGVAHANTDANHGRERAGAAARQMHIGSRRGRAALERTRDQAGDAIDLLGLGRRSAALRLWKERAGNTGADEKCRSKESEGHGVAKKA